MKGIVFTELIEMVEDDLGIDIADRMLQNADSKSGGAYTSVGTYDHTELIRMVVALSEETGVPVPTLVQSFGRYLFGRFSELYPVFFEDIRSSPQFLESVDRVIHVEVRKLYPDAELPRFEMEQPQPGIYEMHYRSRRPFADLAEGLILACIDYFQDSIDVVRTDLDPGDGTSADFRLHVHRLAKDSQAMVAT